MNQLTQQQPEKLAKRELRSRLICQHGPEPTSPLASAAYFWPESCICTTME